MHYSYTYAASLILVKVLIWQFPANLPNRQIKSLAKFFHYMLMFDVVLFNDHQVEVTKFEELEETYADVRLKQALWQSQKDWAVDYQIWMKVGASS